MELSLGPDAVKDNSINGDSDYFDDDLDKAADKGPILSKSLANFLGLRTQQL